MVETEVQLNPRWTTVNNEKVNKTLFKEKQCGKPWYNKRQKIGAWNNMITTEGGHSGQGGTRGDEELNEKLKWF